MERLFKIFERRIKNTDTRFIRGFINKINWDERLISIKGSRGVGKTTLILQYIKLNKKIDTQTLYVSLDDIYFQTNNLVDLVEEFYVNGGKYLFLDEVHKYGNWSREIKNIYDNYDDLKLVFTSSSVLEINKGEADLSRRAVTYELNGLSFREYLELGHKINFPELTLEDILENHVAIAQDLTSEERVIKYFKKYLENGYFPFFKEGETSYYQKINNVINLTIETDIPFVFKTEFKTIYKVKKLLHLIATSLPYEPNISKLSKQLETSSRNSTLLYLDYLDKAKLISNLKTSAKGNNYLVKPDKIYLENTNLMFAISDFYNNKGTVRETFFNNQLQCNHVVKTSKESDFLIDNKYTFEIGGKGKNSSQIKNVKNAFIAADNIEVGFRNKIPLWMFGLMY